MGKLSPESEQVARDWLRDSEGNPETAALRHAVGILLAEAEAEAERLRHAQQQFREALISFFTDLAPLFPGAFRFEKTDSAGRGAK